MPGPVHAMVAAALILIAAHGASLGVQHPWFRYLDAQLPAAGYVTLQNASQSPATVIGASSPGCARLMLHESVTKNGVDSMHAVASVRVPGHGSFAFSPGRYHLMCMHPKMRVGAHIPVTFTLAGGGSVSASFPVFGPAGPPASSR